jgi:mannan endo-1,4-beta-mannosidase
LILSLVNNWDGYGGKKQYVQWARDQGHYLNADDDFLHEQCDQGLLQEPCQGLLSIPKTCVNHMNISDDLISYI